MPIGCILGRKKKKATHHCSLSTLSSEPIKRKKGQHPEVTWIGSCILYLRYCVTKSRFPSPWANIISLTFGCGFGQRTGVPQRSASRELLLFNILPHFLLNCLGFRCSCKWGLSSCQFKQRKCRWQASDIIINCHLQHSCHQNCYDNWVTKRAILHLDQIKF